MAPHLFPPRKRRTRQHVIADQSINHVERFVIDEGHIAQRQERDYGYDLLLYTFDESGYIEPGVIYLQVKASETLAVSGTDPFFDLDVRDYHLWITERMPVYLILFDASRRRAFWSYVQKYFAENPSRRPKQGAKTVRTLVSSSQTLNRRAIARMRSAKQAILDEDRGVLYHV